MKRKKALVVRDFKSKTIRKIKSSYLKLVHLFYGGTWQEGEPHLYEFNKTIITLASSALVLSFSVIQLTGSGVNKSILGWSWTVLVITLIMGAILYFLRFMTTVSMVKVKKREERVTTTAENFFEHKDTVIYSILVISAFFLSLFQLALFITGISLLMQVAFKSL